MERPSKYWTGVLTADSKSDKSKRIQQIFATANFKYLSDQALQLRKEQKPHPPSHVKCTVNTAEFTSGFNNLILEIAFTDEVYWIARIPHKAFTETDRTSVLSEIATMKIIHYNTTVPIPRVFGFELSSDQPFRYPYVFLEHMPGRSLPRMIADSVPREHHAKVAKQLGKVFVELQRLNFSRIGRVWCGDNAGTQPPKIISMAWHASPGPLQTSLEYFYSQRQSENQEAMALHPSDPDWLTACWVLKTALTDMIVEDRVYGPFPLCHLDLHYGNMLFDDNFNLTAVLDWENAQAAPLEQLSVCPELVGFPGRSDEDNEPILEFKKLVIDAIKEMEQHLERGQLLLDCPALEMDTSDGESERTSLSAFMASPSATIVYRQYMASPRKTLWTAKNVAKLMYREAVTWDQLKTVYGTKLLF